MTQAPSYPADPHGLAALPLPLGRHTVVVNTRRVGQSVSLCEALALAVQQGALWPHPTGGLFLQEAGEALLYKNGARLLSHTKGICVWERGALRADAPQKSQGGVVLGTRTEGGYILHPNVFHYAVPKQGQLPTVGNPQALLDQIPHTRVVLDRNGDLPASYVLPYWALAQMPHYTPDAYTQTVWDRFSAQIAAGLIAHIPPGIGFAHFGMNAHATVLGPGDIAWSAWEARVDGHPCNPATTPWMAPVWAYILRALHAGIPALEPLRAIPKFTAFGNLMGSRRLFKEHPVPYSAHERLQTQALWQSIVRDPDAAIAALCA